MTYIESAIWLIVPIFLSVLLCAVANTKEWAKKKIILSTGIFFGVLGFVLHPTVLCMDDCSKFGGAILLSISINAIILLLLLVFMYVKYGKK